MQAGPILAQEGYNFHGNTKFSTIEFKFKFIHMYSKLSW